jgi:hypothetical protein
MELSSCSLNYATVLFNMQTSSIEEEVIIKINDIHIKDFIKYVKREDGLCIIINII